MSLTLGLNSAVSGLLTAQRNLDVIANNIANVNTKGYTRKSVDQQTVMLDGTGSGVESGALQRNVSDVLHRDMLREQGVLGGLSVSQQYYQRLQELFGQPGSNTSISHTVEKFAEAYATLAAQPTDPAIQWSAANTAETLATRLDQLSGQIQALRMEADRAIAAAVDKVNGHLVTISSMNEQIMRLSASGRDTADLEDRRDTAMIELSKQMDFQYFQRDDGMVMVFSTTGRVLVNVDGREIGHQAVAASQAWMTRGAGDFQPITLNGADLTSEIGSGELKALIDLRDRVLPDLQSELDTLASQLKEEVNKVHNRGTGFPAQPGSFTGSRVFDDPANQTIAFNGTDDVMMTVFDGNGREVAGTGLRALVGAGPVSIAALGAAMQTWLAGQGYPLANVGVDADGHFAVTLNDASASLAFRDQSASARGSAAGDAAISYDADGDGTADGTVSGFSYFLGLNDFFVENRPDVLHDSDVKATNWRLPAAGTLNLSSGGALLGTVNLPAGATLQDAAAALAAVDPTIRAAVVPDGSGYRLRIRYLDGAALTVTGTATAALGMHSSASGLSGSMRLRDDLTTTPALLARGSVQYDTAADRYFLAEGDNSTALQMSQLMSTKQRYAQAGTIGAGNNSFSSYAASIVSVQASAAASVKERYEYQFTLTQELEFQRSAISGVNLDEEMSNMLIYQQAYAAAAKIITTTQELFDILNDMKR